LRTAQRFAVLLRNNCALEVLFGTRQVAAAADLRRFCNTAGSATETNDVEK
jgi:hypothetical protein